MLFLSITIALIISIAFGWLLYKADHKRAVPYPFITAGLRGLLVFLCILLIISPKINKRHTETQKPIVLLLQDNSQSVASALGNERKQYHQKLNQLISQFSSQYRLVTWNLDGAVATDSLNHFDRSGTNITDAINKASELYGQQNLSAFILASDGQYNEGLNPEYADIPLNSALYSIAIGDTAIAQDIRISKVYANKSTSLNSIWEVRADIVASKCGGTQQNVRLLDALGNVVATSPIQINSDRFDATVSFSLKAEKAGLQQYKLSIPKVGAEQNVSNNNASVFVEVLQEKKKILLIAAAPHPDIRAIADALKGLEQYEIVIKTANEMPASLAEYACIIAHQLPSNNASIPENLLKGKSVWYIAGEQSNYFQLNSLQKVINFSMGINPRADEAIFNSAFNLFTLPPKIAAVADQLPPLNVAASGFNILAPSQALFNDPQGKALWAIASGTTPTAVLSGEGIWRWRIYEYKHFGHHNAIDECIRQTINFLCAQHQSKPFRTELYKYVWNNPEHININAYLYNANAETINQPEANITIKDSKGVSRQFSFEKNGTSYRLDIGALPADNYQYTAQTKYNNQILYDKGSFVVEDNKLEAQETGCNYNLMYSLAQKNRGACFDAKTMLSVYDSISRNESIKPLLNEQIEATELIHWKWIFFLILLVAASEWLLRKYWMAM